MPETVRCVSALSASASAKVEGLQRMSEPKPIIDDVRPEDLDAIAQMMHDDMIALGRASSLEDMRELCRMAHHEAAAENRVFFLAARLQPGAQPIGMLLAHERLSVRFGGRSLWVEELYVRPDTRMGGVGRALVLQVLALARAQGLRGVDLRSEERRVGKACGARRSPRQ